MKKYFSMLKNRLAVGLEYRSNIFGQFIIDIISLTSTVIFWNAVFKTQDHLSSYSLNDSVLYFFITPLIGALTYIFVSDELGNEIRMGVMSNYLLKPYSLQFEALTRALASKLNNFLTTIPFYTILIVVISVYTNHFMVTLQSVFLFIFAICMGFTLHFIFDLTIAYCAFWVGEVWAFTHFKRVIFLIFGGLMFPLDFLPPHLFSLFSLLPFQFMYYIPNTYLLGKRSVAHVPQDAILFIFWFIVLLLVQRFVWKKGLVQYEAQGG